MKAFGVSQIRLALALLNNSEQKKYFFAVFAQSILGFLDLLGVGLISLIGSLTIRGVQSLEPGNRVSVILEILHLNDNSFQSQVAILAIIAVALLSVKTILSYLLAKKLLHFLANIASNLSAILINKTLSSGHLSLQGKSRAEVQYSTGDGVTAMTVGILGLLSNLIADFFLLAILLLGIFLVDPNSATITFVFFGIIGGVLYFSLHKRARTLSKRVVELNIEGSNTLFEVLGAFREIYVRNRRNFYSEKLSSIKREFAHKNAEQTLLPNLSKYAIELSVTVGTMIVAGVQFSTQDSSRAAASLALFLAAGSRLAPALLRIQQSSIQIQSNLSLAGPTFQLISEYKNLPVLLEENLEEVPVSDFIPEVFISDLDFSYRNNEKYELSNVNLRIHEGEVCAFVGPSGSGKSTLVDVILGLIEPTSGSVSVSKVSPRKAISIWPGKIGYVPQQVNLINGTVSDNLEIGYPKGTFSVDSMRAALNLARLEDIDLDLQVGESGSKLSGGQRQRLGIARALLLNPKLLILDEATSALDTETESAISSSLEMLRGKVTIIVVAHRLSTVKSASKIAYIENGIVSAIGTFEEVRAQNPSFDTQAKLLGL